MKTLSSNRRVTSARERGKKITLEKSKVNGEEGRKNNERCISMFLHEDINSAELGETLSIAKMCSDVSTPLAVGNVFFLFATGLRETRREKPKEREKLS